VVSAHYLDRDGDGRGDAATRAESCTPPAGTVASSDDCDDMDANVRPGATDECNGIDDDCSGGIDEGLRTTFYADVDGDGAGDPGATMLACAPPPGHVTVAGDCDDADPRIGPAAPEVCDGAVDEDCDGAVDDGCACRSGDLRPCGTDVGACETGTQRCTAGVLGTCEGAMGPAAETCNGLDDDCDGTLDEGALSVFYRDADGDGFGDPSATATACTAPAGYVELGTDCDDACLGCSPAGTEVCDGAQDENCSGAIDEGCTCTNGATRACGTSDVGACARGTESCVAGRCGACSGAVEPVPETCNGADDDCDGAADDGVLTTFYQDADGDGFGSPGVTMAACTAPPGYVTSGTDCADDCVACSPSGTEVCDATGRDEDCDGTANEGCACTDGATQPCGTDVGECVAGTQTCAAGSWGACVGELGPMMERCDGRDDDCDGVVDQGFECSGAGSMACATACGSTGSRTCGPTCAYGACVPPAEACNGADDDCDGVPDETFACVRGASTPCTTTCGSTGSATCTAGCTVPTTCAPPAEACNGVDDDCDGAIDDGVWIARVATLSESGQAVIVDRPGVGLRVVVQNLDELWLYSLTPTGTLLSGSRLLRTGVTVPSSLAIDAAFEPSGRYLWVAYAAGSSRAVLGLPSATRPIDLLYDGLSYDVAWLDVAGSVARLAAAEIARGGAIGITGTLTTGDYDDVSLARSSAGTFAANASQASFGRTQVHRIGCP
jgi:hypothetical protein